MLKVIKVLERTTSGIAALALIVMIVVSVANALGRTWLGTPVYGANEILAQWLLPVVVLLALPGAQVWKEHYVVSIFVERLHGRSLALLKSVGYGAAAVACAPIAWFGLEEALSKADVHATAGITSLPVFPFLFLVPVGFTLAAFVFACDAVLVWKRPSADLNTGTGEPIHHEADDAA